MRATAKSPAMIELRQTYAGITAVARRLGCSREHLSRVLHGQRKPNERLARALKRIGVAVG